jgi:phytoene synthase
MDDNATHCMEVVRVGSPDRYLSALYAPAESRPALFAIYAFNVEIARIRDAVSEPMPGEIRLQWWKDVVTGEGGEAPSGNPVAAALLAAIEHHGLPREAFARMCEARIFDLYDDPMPDRQSLEGYCGETASALIQLAALVIDPQAARKAADAAGHAGVAEAIAGLLRLLPLHRRRGQLYVPADMLSAAGADDDTILNDTDRDAAQRVVSAMVALARDHLAHFDSLRGSLSASLRPAFLPALLAPAYLDRLERAGSGVLDEVVTLTPLRRQWLMLRAKL